MHLAAGLLWLIHFLPLPVIAAIGRGLGNLLWLFARERRNVVRTNLRLCFPDMPEAEREALGREHVRLVTRSYVERCLAWWSSEARIRRLVRIEGLENFKVLAAQRATILLVPHFVGLDMCATRLALEINAVSIYANQKRNPLLSRLLLRGRSRFGDQLLLSRQDGVRSTVKAMRDGRPFYYLPDLDYGRRDAIFVPFFGVPAATITGLPRLAQLGRAAVVPCVACMLPGGAGYVLKLGDPWDDFPSNDVEADTRRMNEAIEQAVRQMPAQYYWVHKRFKTRPHGEAKFY